MTNTEKPTSKTEQKKTIVETPKISKKTEMKTPIKKPENKKVEDKTEDMKMENKTEDLKTEETKEIKKPKEKQNTAPKVKKDFAMVNVKNLAISTKDAKAVCRFIKNKKISKAIEDLEKVLKLKKAVPMKGEIPHRKGPIMSGRFPQKTSKNFIMLLKSLQGNANFYDLETPIVKEAIANIGVRPFGRFGIKRKRSHITLKAISKPKSRKQTNEKNKEVKK